MDLPPLSFQVADPGRREGASPRNEERFQVSKRRYARLEAGR
jgi:hypothetical protein